MARLSNNTALNALVEKSDSNFLGSSFSKTITFAGGTTNAIGDSDGTGNPATIATVTGTVLMQVVAVCKTNLAGDGATVEVGTAATTAGLIAQTTATDIAANEIWHDATPDASVELSSVILTNVVSSDVILTVATANATAGVIDFYIFWRPISSDGLVA